MTTITTVGAFTYDSATSEVQGPAEFMRSTEYRRCVASIENGTSHVFRAGLEHSPNVETALLVTIQTCYAGWKGARDFHAMREAAAR